MSRDKKREALEEKYQLLRSVTNSNAVFSLLDQLRYSKQSLAKLVLMLSNIFSLLEFIVYWLIND